MIKKIFSHSAIAASIKLGNGVLSIAMNMLAAKLLSHHDFGVYAVIFSCLMGFTFCGTFGIHISVIRFFPQIEQKHSIEIADYFLWMCYKKMLYLWRYAAIALLGLAGLYYVNDYWNHGDAALNFLVYPFIIILGFGLASTEFLSAALRLKERHVVGVAARDIGWRSLVCLVTWTLWQARYDIGVLGIYIIMALLMMFILWIQSEMFIKTIKSSVTHFEDKRLYIEDYYSKDAFSKSLLYSWVHIISQTVMFQSSVALIGLILGAKEAGVYFAADRFAFIMSLVSIALTLIATPVLSKTYHQNDLVGLRKLYVIMGAVGGIVMLPLFLVIYFYGDILLVKAYDENFLRGHQVLIWLSTAWFVSTILGPIVTLAQAAGYEKRVFWISFVLSIATLIGLWTIIPVYKMAGAAFIVSLSLIIHKITLLLTCGRKIFFEKT